MKCLEIATLQDFAPNTLELLAELHLAKRSALLAMRVEEPPSGSSCLRACNKSINQSLILLTEEIKENISISFTFLRNAAQSNITVIIVTAVIAMADLSVIAIVGGCHVTMPQSLEHAASLQ